MRPEQDEDRIPLGLDDEEFVEDDYEDEEFAPGPDERDRDLIDGTWEERYYSGQHRQRNWGAIGLAMGIILVIALVLPGILVFVG
jgi:hypothetical protein